MKTNTTDSLFKSTGREAGGSGKPSESQKWADGYVMDNFDVNEDGELSKTEKKAAEGFLDEYDLNNDGLAKDEIDTMKWDSDGDGKLNKEEKAVKKDSTDEDATGPEMDEYDMYRYFGSEDGYQKAVGEGAEGEGGKKGKAAKDNETSAYITENSSMSGDMGDFIDQIMEMINKFFGGSKSK
jgi:hypothetical protein